MHAESNGWYWLAGALGGAGERYHGGRGKSADECLDIFAKHCRIARAEAESIRERIRGARTVTDEDPAGWKAARAEWASIMETMRPRWKREAEECIARHNLKVYGDPWEEGE